MTIRNLLLPFSAIYGAGMALRNYAFEKKMFAVTEISKPAISIGNITAGGSGKTPCVELIADMLLCDGKIPGVVSRGYQRKSTGMVIVSDGKNILVDSAASGDEPMQIAKKHPHAIVVVAERKSDAARKAAALGADCILLDDGFQRRDLTRTCDIVLCGDELLTGKNMLLPAGNGREPLRSLRRADIVLAPLFDRTRNEAAEKNFRRYSDAPLFFFSLAPEKIDVPFLKMEQEPASLRNTSLFALTGIANPQRFLQTILSLGGILAGTKHFPDHHWFTMQELKNVVTEARQHNAAVITTEKDWMRIEGVQETQNIFEGVELLILRVAMKIEEGKVDFKEIVWKKAGLGSSQALNEGVFG